MLLRAALLLSIDYSLAIGRSILGLTTSTMRCDGNRTELTIGSRGSDGFRGNLPTVPRSPSAIALGMVCAWGEGGVVKP
jgi:hypothetical protein